MLTLGELVTLQRDLHAQQVLSVYVCGIIDDPARRRAWRVQLDHALKTIRQRLASASHDARAEWERCEALLEERLPAMGGAIGAPGWAAFITRDGVKYADALPVEMPTVAVYREGICIAPYVRALKQHRPVYVAVVDARKADMFSYQAGILEPLETFRAHVVMEPPSHMGDAPRAGFHSGVRGSTGRDAVQREHVEGTERMLRELTDRLAKLAAADSWVLIGGIPRESTRAIDILPRGLRERALLVESLDVHATPAEISIAAQHGASQLRNRGDLQQLDEIIEHAGEHGLAVLGPDDTRRALDSAQVLALFMTHRYLMEHTTDAEDAVRAALEQRATIEEVSGEAADRLNPFGGIGAKLRYVLAEAEPVPA